MLGTLCLWRVRIAPLGCCSNRQPMENQAEFILRLAQAALADLDEEEATREKASKRYRHGGFHPTPYQSVD